MMPRLSSRSALPPAVRGPSYSRSAPSGIVHLGTGAFHRAHQAVYTDDALAKSGGGWMITGVSLRSPDVADQLNPQDGLYTLLTLGPAGVEARVIGSIRGVLVASDEREKVLDALAAPETRIVSLTITEKGYGLDPKTGGLDRTHPAIAADLADPGHPKSAVGFIVEALRRRHEAGLPGFTVLSCDNLPSNGKVVARLVRDFAAEAAPEIAAFIEADVSFPSTMVDRITPAATHKTFDDVRALTGCADPGAVETELFSQWIIEDDFVAGRPDWEAGGALFVSDVVPYEKMKLRMLNGAHSMLAYSGFLAGHRYVRDVMGDPALAALVVRHMKAAAATLDSVPGVDLDRYAADLQERFRNPAIAHETYQIAMDGTQKLPQRLLEPAMVALERGQRVDAFAFAVAAWMRYALGRREDGEPYALRDPREKEIAAVLEGAGKDTDAIAEALLALPGLFPAVLTGNGVWTGAVRRNLSVMMDKGMRPAIDEEARGFASS
ncbi:MAG: mannitol dehydrogenase family protein [Hyphomicrobiales bacterium]|nr:mannitol dehydrogenase family protein [Hyphomicrobiales bacterium]